jgi:hypothetical protein
MGKSLGLTEELEIRKPSVIVLLFWVVGFLLIGFAAYVMVTWHGWIGDLKEALPVLAALISGVNAIATGALIDMHTMKTKKRRHFKG